MMARTRYALWTLGLMAALAPAFRPARAASSGPIERGLDLEATLAAVELGGFRERLAGDDPIAGRAWDNFVPPTIERAWLEARGELPE